MSQFCRAQKIKLRHLFIVAGLFVTAGDAVGDTAAVATVDGIAIGAAEFERALGSLAPESRAEYVGEAGKARFLDELINQKLLIREAERRGVSTDEAVQQQIREAAAQIVIVHLLEQIKREIVVSDDEAHQYFDQHADDFRSVDQLRLRDIVIRPTAVDDAARTQARAKAAKVVKLIQAGGDFAMLAKQISDDKTTGAQGGDLGLLAISQLDGELARVAVTLEPGQVYGPIDTSDGSHIIKLEEKRLGEAPTFEFVENKVRDRARAAKQKRAIVQLLNDLRGKAKIDIDRDLLGSLQP